MEHTKHYHLSQWSMEDRIQMQDFNADNAKIDAALKAHDHVLSLHTNALTKCGNCQLYYFTYTGDGKEAPFTITFPKLPLAVFISSDAGNGFTALRGSSRCSFTHGSGVYGYHPTWSESGLTLEREQEAHQMNYLGRVYTVVALLAMDE